MNEPGTYQRLVTGLRWFTLSRLVVQSISWAFTLIVIRLVSPQDYGLLSMMSSVLLLGSALVDCGLGPVMVTHKDMTDEIRRSVLGTVLTVATIAVVIVQLCARPLSAFFHEPRLELLLRIGCLQLFTTGVAVIPRAVLSRRMMFREQAISYTTAGLTQGVVTIVLALSGFSYWALLTGSMVASVIDLSVTTYLSKTWLWPTFNPGKLKPFLTFSGYTLGDKFLWYFVQNTDSIAVGRLSGARDLGLLSISKEIAHLPLDKIGDIAAPVTVAGFSRLQNDQSALVEGFRRMVQFGGVVAFPVFWGLLSVAQLFVPIVLGDTWLDTTVPIMVYCLVLPLRAVWTLFTRAVVGMGRPDISFQNQLLWVLIVMPAIIFAAFRGINAVAMAWALSFPILFLVSSRRIAKAVGVAQSTLLAPLVRPATAAFIMLVVVFGCHVLMNGIPDRVRLAFEVLVGAAAYVAALRLVGPTVFSETIYIARGMLGLKQTAVANAQA